ncbi:VOC family protein [Paenibacillus sp. GCM10023252]|uniref:VOC family protein n=1 Tax=Paenibacillus sp. GCM10023252 TaxID=3252649 RepID=UPI00360B3710
MIQGLYEAHLPVSNIDKSIEFYSKLGLELAWKDEDSAFFWIEKEKSWIGLWQGEEYKTSYHPSLRHFAFRVSYEDIKQSINWLNSINVEPVTFGSRDSIEPFVRPYSGNASVYFNDPDGNSLELMCFINVPERLKNISNKLSIEEWEDLLKERE